MKLAYMLAVAALALAPAAHAQDLVSCSDISATLDAALTDFEDDAGEELGDFIYKSELTMPGANACTLELEWDSVLFCLWNHESEASARAAYDRLTAAVNTCLAGWEPRSVMSEPPVPETALMHNVRSGSGDFTDMEVLLHMDRYEEDGKVTYEVWYELTYYL